MTALNVTEPRSLNGSADIARPEPVLRIDELTKIYGDGCPDCVRLTGPGRTIGIVGESGSGKTTVLRCLYGDLEPTSGWCIRTRARVSTGRSAPAATSPRWSLTWTG